VDVAVTKTDENAQRVVEVVNTALAALGGAIAGLEVTEDDVVNLSAEWSAIKSEGSLTRTLLGSTERRKCGWFSRDNKIRNAHQ
jgi:hypothetical protein